MIHAPPMHAITNPSQFGLTPVDMVFGECRLRPDRMVVTSHELVMKDETIFIFIGLDSVRTPILLPFDADVIRSQLGSTGTEACHREVLVSMRYRA